jgi:hypothetical protein
VLQDGMDGVRFRADAAPAPLRAPCVPLGSTPPMFLLFSRP